MLQKVIDDKVAEIDFGRIERLGIAEAIYCKSKSASQINVILNTYELQKVPALLTRLSAAKLMEVEKHLLTRINYDAISLTAFYAGTMAKGPPGSVALVTGGTADLRVAREVARVLDFHRVQYQLIVDVGVAGLHRLLPRVEEIETNDVVVIVAGFEGALFSVIGGMISKPIVAIPTSVGYGVTAGGRIALMSALGSCAPGVTVVNIDNGYGGASAALRILNSICRQTRTVL